MVFLWFEEYMNPLTGKNQFLMKRYLYPKQHDTYNYLYEEHGPKRMKRSEEVHEGFFWL
jgi:hypothetical protein